MKITLTDSEIHTAIRALEIASDEYRKMAESDHPPRIKQSFNDQATWADALKAKLEELQ